MMLFVCINEVIDVNNHKQFLNLRLSVQKEDDFKRNSFNENLVIFVISYRNILDGLPTTFNYQFQEISSTITLSLYSCAIFRFAEVQYQ